MLKNSKLIQAAALIMSICGLAELPIVEGKVKFEDDAAEKLKTHLTEPTFNSFIEAFNKDLADSKTAADLQATIEALLKENDVSSKDWNQILADAKASGKDDNLLVLQAIEAQIKKLGEKAEDDLPIDNVMRQKGQEIMKHNSTHVFSSGKDYDAIDHTRPWNGALAKGGASSATDYASETVIQRLQGDSDLYFRENPTEIKSLHRDNFQLPDFWPKRLNVDDRVADGTVVTAEITQGRKYSWLPKNVQEINAEEGKIYPVQIDAEWAGFELQKIEASWLNMLNKEGSQPEKMSFVRFLVGELMKRARVEDRVSTLNGIFVQTPKDATKPGKYINRQNGLFYQLWKARDINKKFRFFEMGPITAQNVYDYFHSSDSANLGFLNRLPKEVSQASTDLVIYMDFKVWGWYKNKYKEINGTNMDFAGVPEHLEGYPRIRVQTFVDQENANFIFATFADNIEILENIPAEKSAYRFQTLLRKVYMLADYKLGVRLIHIGREVNPNDPEEFKVQSVWSNDQPIFLEEKFIPAFDNTTGKLQVDYKNIQVDENWKTDITEFTGVTPGQLIRIRGNSALVALKNVVDNAKIALTGDTPFPLNTAGTLTLYVKSDLTVMELRRDAAVTGATSSDVNFTGTEIDSNSGSVFRFAGVANTTVNSILHGVDGKTIRIYGGAGGTVTFANVPGLISVGGASVGLAGAVNYLELVKVNGVWTKTITA